MKQQSDFTTKLFCARKRHTPIKYHTKEIRTRKIEFSNGLCEQSCGFNAHKIIGNGANQRKSFFTRSFRTKAITHGTVKKRIMLSAVNSAD